MIRKRSNRLARRGRKHRKIILLTVLLGALSLVGALSYSGASEANQKFVKAENEKLRLLEEQFDIAKDKEKEVQLEDQRAKEEAERAIYLAQVAKQKAADEAARKAREAAERNILAKTMTTAKIVNNAQTSTPTKTTTTTKTPETTTPKQTETSNMKYLGALSSTAYTHTGNNMANGEKPYEGAVACNLVPLGTKIYIEGYGYYVVKDRIGSGSQLDIFMDTYDECIKFGRRTLKVYVVN